MKATLSMIQEAALGCARITETEDGICFYRFTEEQEEFYRTYNSDFYYKTFATAGVRLEFVTDSTTLSIETVCKSASSRKFVYHDIICNGIAIDHFGGTINSKKGYYGGCYDLGEGIKTIQIYFPWTAQSTLRSLELDDGASFSPVKRPTNMLIFGDSITHGYDANYPAQSYSSILADKLNANAINKGIGGELFMPELLDSAEDIDPAVITVAYGTNDWSVRTAEDMENGIRGFYTKLSQKYPNAKIFGISPIWRSNESVITPAGKFSDVIEKLERLTADLPNVTILNGYHLIPHDKALFTDGLHPNSIGSVHYGLNLADKILKML